VYVVALRRADPPSKESYLLKKRARHTRTVEPIKELCIVFVILKILCIHLKELYQKEKKIEKGKEMVKPFEMVPLHFMTRLTTVFYRTLPPVFSSRL
jgi:hypothetical protein